MVVRPVVAQVTLLLELSVRVILIPQAVKAVPASRSAARAGFQFAAIRFAALL
jgi:hypothetical protein